MCDACAFDLSPSTLAVLYLPVPRVTVDNSETHFETHLETHFETHLKHTLKLVEVQEGGKEST